MRINKLGAAALMATSIFPLQALADVAVTRGGVKITSDDGQFEASVGGRIHFDGNFPLDDDANNANQGIGEQTSDLYFRRARLTMKGKAYGWSYKFENDFAGQSSQNGSGFREMWIGTKLHGVKIRVGQAKPYRGMEELTSSNEVLFTERPFASASSIYGGRQYTTGLFADGHGNRWGWGLAGYNLRNAAGPETDGMGVTGRLYGLPWQQESCLLHVGLSASIDNPANATNNAPNTVAPSNPRWAGRSGPRADLSALATTDEQSTLAVELAGQSGPFTAQAEYAAASFAQPVGPDIDVDTYYVQAAWLISGHVRPYNLKKGAFKSPKVTGEQGAIEAKLRYDFIESDGLPVETEASYWALGLNWYINPAVRLMLEYISGEEESAAVPDGSLDVIATRLQFAF